MARMWIQRRTDSGLMYIALPDFRVPDSWQSPTAFKQQRRGAGIVANRSPTPGIAEPSKGRLELELRGNLTSCRAGTCRALPTIDSLSAACDARPSFEKGTPSERAGRKATGPRPTPGQRSCQTEARCGVLPRPAIRAILRSFPAPGPVISNVPQPVGGNRPAEERHR